MLFDSFLKPTKRTFEILHEEIEKMKCFELEPPPNIKYNNQLGISPPPMFWNSAQFYKG